MARLRALLPPAVAQSREGMLSPVCAAQCCCAMLAGVGAGV